MKAEWTRISRDVKCPCGNWAAFVCKPCSIHGLENHFICFATDCKEAHEEDYHNA